MHSVDTSEDQHQALARYLEANRFIDEGLIRLDPPSSAPATRTRRDWMRERVLPAIDHPQRAYPAVHVAGTSGKGSVAQMIANLLQAAGRRVGLHLSPYVQVATEKLWVDGDYASADQYAELVRWIRPLALQLKAENGPAHGLASVAICLEHFRRTAVDIAVIEAGVGGAVDITNVLQTRVAVITNVGPDHLQTLGPTLKDVAEHKVGIIHGDTEAVVADDREQGGLLYRAAKRRAASVGATLHVVDVAGLSTVEINAAIAIAACYRTGLIQSGQGQDSPETLTEVRQAITASRLPCRFESVHTDEGQEVLLDGAHNRPKLEHLAAYLGQYKRDGGDLHLVLGLLGSKFELTRPALRLLAEQAKTVTLTEPQVYGKPAAPAQVLSSLFEGAKVIPSPDQALDAALARASGSDLVVCTGSMYLVGALRGRFYGVGDVISRRRSFW